MKVALVGNPNSGKTTLFNALTGSNQYVGNWPGVTVEKKEGKLKSDRSIEITDLPGIYSLSPYSPEEVIARNFIIDEHPDVILNIVDGSNLERNLYLTTQIMEMGTPVVVAVNMMDVVRRRGDVIHVDQLEQELGCPVVEVSALKNEGIDEVVNCLKTVRSDSVPNPIALSAPVEEAVDAVRKLIEGSVPTGLERFYSLKLLEGDQKAIETLRNRTAHFKDEVQGEGLKDRGAQGKLIQGEQLQCSQTQSEQAQSGQTQDEQTQNAEQSAVDNALLSEIAPIIANLEKAVDDDAESAIINDRYAYVSSIIDHCRQKKDRSSLSTSDKIDRVVTNRILALPIFVVVMTLVYYLSISTVGTAATDWANDNLFGDGWFVGAGQEQFDEDTAAHDEAVSNVEAFESAATEKGLDPSSADFISRAETAGVVGTYEQYDEETGENTLVEVDAAAYGESLAASMQEAPDPADYGMWVPGIPALVKTALVSMGVADWLQALILDGVVAGVGAVLGFVPQMLVLFFLLALLESCGYMARIAFILDRVFRHFGLSGRSFIPILVGTGCGVPGIMASRTIENQNDRRMTIMTTTFIPCSAKMPIIALFAAAIFGGQWWIAPSAYFLGLVAILCSGIILKKTRFFAGDVAPFVMELPAYHLPTLSGVLRSTWERAWSFIKKAGTVIFLACIIIWFISSYGIVEGGIQAVESQNDSILALLGGAIAWIFAPLGWGDWQAASATVTGLIAKENVVGTFGVLYTTADASWYQNVQLAFTAVSAYSFMAFNLLCAPCFAAMGAIKREMNNRKWFWAAIGYQCGIAWVVALWIYQFGGLLTGEVGFSFFTVLAITLFGAFLWLLLRPRKRAESVQGGLAMKPERAL